VSGSDTEPTIGLGLLTSIELVTSEALLSINAVLSAKETFFCEIFTREFVDTFTVLELLILYFTVRVVSDGPMPNLSVDKNFEGSMASSATYFLHASVKQLKKGPQRKKMSVLTRSHIQKLNALSLMIFL